MCICLYLWIKILKYMHMHVWLNLALECLLFIWALGFLRKVAEYIRDRHSGILSIQVNSDEEN